MNNVLDWNRIGNKYDKIARKLAKRVWLARNIIAVDNPDQYGVDLLLYRGIIESDNPAIPIKKIGYCEVELAGPKVWLTGNFHSPLYGKVLCPIRKEKLLRDQGDGKPVFWMYFSNDENNFLTILGKHLLERPAELFDKHAQNFKKKDKYFFWLLEDDKRIIQRKVPK